MIRESGELWIGANRTPPGWRPAANTYEGVRVIEAQVGGTFTHHPALFGIAFDVPANDPLAELGNSYYGTDLPGHWNDEYSTGLDIVIDARARLRELDLDLDDVCYFHLAEAYVPLDAERAWNYAVRRSLKLITKHDLRASEFALPATLGLSQWSDVTAYLEAAWLAAASRSGTEYWQCTVPQRWFAALVLANSD